MWLLQIKNYLSGLHYISTGQYCCRILNKGVIAITQTHHKTGIRLGVCVAWSFSYPHSREQLFFLGYPFPWLIRQTFHRERLSHPFLQSQAHCWGQEHQTTIPGITALISAAVYSSCPKEELSKDSGLLVPILKI